MCCMYFVNLLSLDDIYVSIFLKTSEIIYQGIDSTFQCVARLHIKSLIIKSLLE